jgi:CheY-like chemotaxis protein
LIGDPTRISQIITNLVSNAIKFTAEGFVMIKLSLTEKIQNKNSIKFEVLDTGIGIDASKLSSVFESFTQEDESTTRKYGGTGLGLSISKQLVELMGGELNVQSKKESGTIFSFTLELAVGTNNDLPKKTTSLQNIENLTNKDILLVEDNEINQFLGLTLLKKWKLNVDVAENGKEAIDKVKQKNYDVILMDMQMPVMGGIEATKIIREELKINTPIIALTANAIKGDEQKCIDAGMNDYISKPFEHSDLFNKVLKAINNGK